MTEDSKPAAAMSTIADLVAHYANAWKGIVDTFSSVEKSRLGELVGAYTQAELDCQSAQARNVDAETHKINVDVAREALMDVFNYLHKVEEEPKLLEATETPALP